MQTPFGETVDLCGLHAIFVVQRSCFAGVLAVCITSNPCIRISTTRIAQTSMTMSKSFTALVFHICKDKANVPVCS